MVLIWNQWFLTAEHMWVQNEKKWQDIIVENILVRIITLSKKGSDFLTDLPYLMRQQLSLTALQSNAITEM